MAPEKNLRFMTVVQLREECTNYNLPTNGTKADLVKRIKEHLKNVATEIAALAAQEAEKLKEEEELKAKEAAAAAEAERIKLLEEEKEKSRKAAALEAELVRKRAEAKKAAADVEKVRIQVQQRNVEVEVEADIEMINSESIKEEQEDEDEGDDDMILMDESTGSLTEDAAGAADATEQKTDDVKMEEETSEDVDDEKPEPEFPELPDNEIEEFVLDKNQSKQQITCKLCLHTLSITDEEGLTAHLDSEEHIARLEQYKDRARGHHLVGAYVTCQLCDREMAYDEWDYHQDTDRHNLNKLLKENGVLPIKVPYALIQKKIDEMNSLESPLIGLFWIHEIIEAKSFDTFKVKYICYCCNLKEKDDVNGEQIIEHIQSREHIINAVKKHHMMAYEACLTTTQTFNQTRPAAAKPRKVDDELMHYIRDNGHEFFRRHRLKTKINLDDEFTLAMKVKYGSAHATHSIQRKFPKVELEPDQKAKIQDEMDRCKKPIAGLDLISERRYLNGDLEYFCILCHREVERKDVPNHLTQVLHKKKFLHRFHADLFAKVMEEGRWIENIGRAEAKAKQKRAEKLAIELCAKHLDKFPRPQVQVCLKAGKSMPEFDELVRNRRDDKKDAKVTKRRAGASPGRLDGGPPSKRGGYGAGQSGRGRGRGGRGGSGMGRGGMGGYNRGNMKRGQMNDYDFGNEDMGGGYGGNQMGGYGGNRNLMGGYGGNRNQMGGYGGNRNQMGGYGGNQMGGYGGNRNQMGNYGGNRNQMGNYGGNQMGGYGGNQMEGYGGKQMGGYGGNQMGGNGGNQMGGNGGNQMGGYGGGSRGGFRGNRMGGGFNIASGGMEQGYDNTEDTSMDQMEEAMIKRISKALAREMLESRQQQQPQQQAGGSGMNRSRGGNMSAWAGGAAGRGNNARGAGMNSNNRRGRGGGVFW
ncbi:uncharacterized protein LOC141904199 [Tubulanus polymorphus]|uniref:uncharacterized protein LOC141904199 n=1 Tax=Tubulanus polymorphus TaxID=672921 RepID=UPI003DA5D603